MVQGLERDRHEPPREKRGQTGSTQHNFDCRITDKGRTLANEVATALAERNPPASFWVDHDIEVVGRGEERIVVSPETPGLIEGNCILKVSMESPPDQNRRELANWQAAPPGVREVFAPIITHGKSERWLLMPRADGEGTPVDLVRIEETLDEHGWSCRGLHPGNIGRFDGKPRVIDYGMRCIADGEVVR